ncbi:MAG: Holliday junction branch migration protein RuvA [Thermodesulfobacteriota bacterium]|nr:Holliday junction branch migration protein RuvA [Thermodesulfobacteriota bacterium]
MIGFLRGYILKAEADGILLLAGDVGYNILLPGIVGERMSEKKKDTQVSLYIYYHQTERQPKPVLIGFTTEAEKAFFQLFISVDAIGPLKAAKAMEKSVSEIAMAIENQDINFLSGLKGIGKRTAQKIVAALHGKAGQFFSENSQALDSSTKHASPLFVDQVLSVLVGQLGHTPAEARMLIKKAMQRNPSISGAEALFDEVYKGEQP